MSVWSYHYN